MLPTSAEPGQPTSPLSGELFEEIVRRVTEMLGVLDQESDNSAATLPAEGSTTVPQQHFPQAPKNIAETGLSPTLLLNLVLKWSSIQTLVTEKTLADLIRLPDAIISEILDQLSSQGAIERFSGEPDDLEHSKWQLTDAGRRRATAAFTECRYLGPAPVSRSHYLQQCTRDATHNLEFCRDQVKTGLKPLVIDQKVLDALGTGLCRGHSMILYGESGNGKSAIAGKLGEVVRQSGGPILVPDAVSVDNRIIALFDPDVHKPLPVVDTEQNEQIDRRWRLVMRPFVQAPTAMQTQLFDMHGVQAGQPMHAPIHIKANGGVLLLDDLGRQRHLAEIADRWLRILENQSDTFRIGPDREVTLPVTCLTLLVTHHSPAESFDSTLLRRIKTKVNIQPPNEHQFREIFRNLCNSRGICYDDWVVLRCLNNRYNPQIPPKASDPHDLLDAIAAICRFEGESPRLTEDLLAQAFQQTVALNESSV